MVAEAAPAGEAAPDPEESPRAFGEQGDSSSATFVGESVRTRSNGPSTVEQRWRACPQLTRAWLQPAHEGEDLDHPRRCRGHRDRGWQTPVSSGAATSLSDTALRVVGTAGRTIIHDAAKDGAPRRVVEGFHRAHRRAGPRRDRAPSRGGGPDHPAPEGSDRIGAGGTRNRLVLLPASRSRRRRCRDGVRCRRPGRGCDRAPRGHPTRPSQP